ncbi:MAG: hypothetical protein BGO98_07505 [Myxococcales bacterium 68-20]|nr:MAG: hypothetical protein BGO98_07505 [Myxococcales bacterium 68-20]
MKSNRSLSDIAARVLTNEARDAGEAKPQARARAIDAIAVAIRQRKRRQRQRWGVFGAVAVAASIALAMGFGHLRGGEPTTGGAPPIAAAASASFVRGSPSLERGGVREPLSHGMSLQAGDRVLVEPGSRATVALADGTFLLVEDRADLVLVSTTPTTTFELGAGSVHADVAKLKPDARFLIRTSDAEVEVRGTSFEVSRAAPDPACGRGTTTRVKVREGVVAVRAAGNEALVRAGESWPRGCSDSTTTLGLAPQPPAVVLPAANEAVPTTNEATPSPAPTGAASATKRSAEPRASDLGAQNDLFEKAVARKRAGDVAGAITSFEELLARHPSSHLAQSARVERMKLLRGVDRERARAAARAYLERYPNGFGRRDAELILSGD